MKNVSVMFLAVPASLKDELREFSQHNFSPLEADSEGAEPFRLDPAILLPVELEQGEHSLDPEKLSWETILSGMLRIISAKGGGDPFSGAPENPAEYRRAGKIKNGDVIDLLNSGVPPGWIDYYRRFVLAVKPGIYHEFTGASVVKARNGEFEMALEISAILEGLFPGSPGILLNKALILEKRAEAMENNGHDAAMENAKALKAYEAALALEPVLPDTRFNAGFFFMHSGEYKRAKECFSHYIDEGEEPEKIRQAKKIVKNINEHGLDESSFMEAYDFIIRGNDEKGLERIREFIEKHPKVWNGWFVLGWALRKLGRFGDGLEALKKAAELGGGGSDLRNETAICLMEIGDFKGAKKELEYALRETSNDIKIISNLGILAMKMGRKEEAASYFRIALELDPEDKIAKQSLESL